MSKGIIYITTTSVRGLIKIGKTGSDQFETRMNILEQNGYWNVSGLKRFFAVEVDDYHTKEKLLHTIFNKSQVPNSELFALDKELAKEVLEAFEGKQIYPKIKEENKEEVKEKSKDKSNNKLRENNSKSSPTTFKILNIPIGSILTFKNDNTITVETIDDVNQVIYNSKTYSLSTVVKVIRNSEQAHRGSDWFKYEGELLTDRRLRLEKEREENNNEKNN